MKDLLNEDHYSYKIHILPIKSIAKLPSIDTLYGLLLSVSQGNLNLGPRSVGIVAAESGKSVQMIL